MEPRQLWERHAVVAEAFCRSDERVRVAQSVLDQAMADRSRMLAAFSVTVGSDGAVAEMLGLNEREVRVARRTVGKEDARAVADELLAQAAQAAQAAEQQQPAAPVEQAYEEPADPAATAMPAQADMPPAGPGMAATQAPPSVPVPPTAPPAVGVPLGAAPTEADLAWSPTLDAVLVSAWQTQVDLSVLATELGVDLPRLTARAQQLSAEGRLAPARATSDQAGRHRRRAGGGGHIPAQPAGEPTQGVSGPMDTGTAWQQWHWQTHTTPEWSTTLPAHDWDGILTQWQANPQHPVAPQHPSAPWTASSF
jgi:hypothetical protein